MRFRDETLGDLDLARAAVAAWRAAHPAGTEAQLLADLGGQFHPDWGVVLRATLFAVDRHQAHEVTGVITEGTGVGR